jgi:hypothetical protein
MSNDVLYAIVVGIVVVVGLALLAVAAGWRSPAARPTESRAMLGMSIGMLFGAVLGAIVWLSTGEFVFWVIFTGGGLVLGLGIGSSWALRHR